MRVRRNTAKHTARFPKDPDKRPLGYHNPPGTRPRGKVDGNEAWPRRRKYVLKGVRP